jgi:hypothetical protein
MKFDEYFAFYMSLPHREQVVANRLPEHFFSQSKKRVHEEIRKRLYGTAYPRTSLIGRRLMSVRARSTARRLKRQAPRKKSPSMSLSNIFSGMKM